MDTNYKFRSKSCRVIVTVFFALITIFIPGTKGTFASAGEKTELSRPPIRSGSEISYPPFCVVDSGGQADGFSVELLRAALSVMGRDVTFRTGPWTQVRDWLEKGEIDALPLVGRTPEREFIYDFTFPYMSIHGAIVVRTGTTDIRGLADLKGRQVAVMKGDNAEEFLRREDRGFEIHTTATFDEALRDLSEGRFDAVVIQRLVALRLIEEKGITDLMVVNRPIEGFRQDFCFAVRESDRETLALLNEGLALVIADGTYRHLHTKWFAAPDLPIHRRIIIGGDQNYPPYEYLDENGRPAGYNVDLTRAIAQAVGLDIEFRLGPWSDIRDALARGEIDALQGLFYSPERDLRFDFTPPHTVNNYVSVMRKGEDPSPVTIAELAGKRIVVQKSDIMHDFAIENGLGDQLTVVGSQEDALRELSEGKHDYALVARVTALYWIKKNGWDNLIVGRHPFLSPEYCYAVPQNQNKVLLSQLGEGLKMIDKTGEYRRISEKWLGVYGHPTLNFVTAFRYVAMVAVPLLLLVFGFFLWSWALRKQVTFRTVALRESEAQYRLLADNVSDVIWTMNLKQRFTYVSPSVEKLLGYTPEEALQVPLKNTLTPESYAKIVQVITKAITRDEELKGATDVTLSLEIEHIRKDGGTLWVEITTSFIRDEDGLLSGFIGITRDIAERKQVEEEKKKLQEQLMQSQKMEAIGTLAGGISHDFNNILSSIIGYTELALDDVEKGTLLEENLQEVFTAGIRAKDLIGQILTLSRHGAMEFKPILINSVVREAVKMLRSTIPTSINFQGNICDRQLVVHADPTQIQQVIINLATNSKHAMSETGGVLMIDVDPVSFNESAENIDLIPGDYARITVSDTGTGVSKNHLEKIFEPYFTTKRAGEGSGLGLSVVHGIVKSHKGDIAVYSELGKGTKVHVYLPLSEQQSIELPAATAEPLLRGTEHILIVDDEPSIVKMQQRNLERLGYAVTTRTSSVNALETFCATPDKYFLVITDMTMPDMSGDKLADEIKKIRPDVPVILCTGFSDNIKIRTGPDLQIDEFISKPIDQKKLAKIIRKLLDKAES